ncbi:uncharacterized protein LOC143294139 [Babylonia areolata]|uniref:uncharacterized protein LOC143294139 n=1 Tax=Babylonia areolata TaxID=304850 RepID=UPI003FD1E857
MDWNRPFHQPGMLGDAFVRSPAGSAGPPNRFAEMADKAMLAATASLYQGGERNREIEMPTQGSFTFSRGRGGMYHGHDTRQTEMETGKYDQIQHEGDWSDRVGCSEGDFTESECYGYYQGRGRGSGPGSQGRGQQFGRGQSQQVHQFGRGQGPQFDQCGRGQGPQFGRGQGQQFDQYGRGQGQHFGRGQGQQFDQCGRAQGQQFWRRQGQQFDQFGRGQGPQFGRGQGQQFGRGQGQPPNHGQYMQAGRGMMHQFGGGPDHATDTLDYSGAEGSDHIFGCSEDQHLGRGHHIGRGQDQIHRGQSQQRGGGLKHPGQGQQSGVGGGQPKEHQQAQGTKQQNVKDGAMPDKQQGQQPEQKKEDDIKQMPLKVEETEVKREVINTQPQSVKSAAEPQTSCEQTKQHDKDPRANEDEVVDSKSESGSSQEQGTASVPVSGAENENAVPDKAQEANRFDSSSISKSKTIETAFAQQKTITDQSSAVGATKTSDASGTAAKEKPAGEDSSSFFSFCKLCNMQFESTEKYVCHTRSMLHAQRQMKEAERQKSGTSTDSKRQTTDSLLDTEPQHQTPGRDTAEEKASKSCSFCELCNMPFDSKEKYVRHTRSMLHTRRQMEEKERLKSGGSTEPQGQTHDQRIGRPPRG